MSEFTVYPGQLNKEVKALSAAGNKIAKMSGADALGMNTVGQKGVKSALDIISTDISGLAGDIEQLSIALNQIRDYYRNTQNKLIGRTSATTHYYRESSTDKGKETSANDRRGVGLGYGGGGGKPEEYYKTGKLSKRKYRSRTDVVSVRRNGNGYTYSYTGYEREYVTDDGTLNIKLSDAYAEYDGEAGLYKDGKFNPNAKVSAGAGYTDVGISYKRTTDNGSTVAGNLAIGSVEVGGTASASLRDESGKLNPSATAGVSGNASAATVQGEVSGERNGKRYTVKGEAGYGVKGNAEVGYKDGKAVKEAEVKKGFNGSASVDCDDAESSSQAENYNDYEKHSVW